MTHHPIFDAMPPFSGGQNAGLVRDYSGAEFRGEWMLKFDVPALQAVLPKPVYDEEYFEWVDLFESVRDASGEYVMMELGAGFGRWGVRAGVAARRHGIPSIKLLFCEGEPQHAAWLRQAVELNGLTAQSTVYEKAVAYGGEPVPFLVSYEDQDSSNWWGQAIGWGTNTPVEGETFHGKQIYRNETGYGQIFVDPVTLEEMTRDLDHIDLIDMDLQMAERELVQNSMDTLNAKVRRVHIGTHAPDIEIELREAFNKAGWRNVWDFGTQKENDTPYGRIAFVDGVQGWINPRLA